jgi:hypothetical protein
VAGYPAQAGIQQEQMPAKRTKSKRCPLRGSFLINWIPAFAGMTQFYANELLV